MQQQEFRELHKLSDSDLQAAIETILRAMPLNLVVKITDLEDEIDAIRTQPDMWRLSAKRGWIFLGDSWQASNAAVILPCFFKVEHDDER